MIRFIIGQMALRSARGQSAFSLGLMVLEILLAPERGAGFILSVKWLCAPRGPEAELVFFFKLVLAPVARGWFFLLVKRLALRAGQRQGGVFRIPPPSLWTPLSPQRVKGCSPLTIPKMRSKPKNASRFAKRIFCASPIYGSAEDFTFLLNFTPCEGVTPAAKQQIGETRKKR